MLTTYGTFQTFPFQRAFADFDNLSRELDRWFAPQRAARPAAPVARYAHMELDETAEAYLLRAEVPGLTQEQLALKFEDGVLTLEGRREVNVPEGFSAVRRERSPLSVARRFTVPRDVEAE